MLVHNYRSHSRLLELPSRLYYDNSLVASADPSLVAAPLWDELQDPNEQDQHPSEEEQHADKRTVRNSEDQQNMEGLAIEEVEDADEEEYGKEDYDEEEEGGVDQLPVNTLFYGVRGQQVPCS